MHPLVKALLDSTVTSLSSTEIAEVTGKDIEEVTADICDMFDQLKLNPLDFEVPPVESESPPQRIFRLPRSEAITLLTGYSGPLMLEIIERICELERRIDGCATPDQDPVSSEIELIEKLAAMQFLSEQGPTFLH